MLKSDQEDTMPITLRWENNTVLRWRFVGKWTHKEYETNFENAQQMGNVLNRGYVDVYQFGGEFHLPQHFPPLLYRTLYQALTRYYVTHEDAELHLTVAVVPNSILLAALDSFRQINSREDSLQPLKLVKSMASVSAAIGKHQMQMNGKHKRYP